MAPSTRWTHFFTGWPRSPIGTKSWWLFQRDPDIARMILQGSPGITYLENSGCDVDGFKVWGSPVQPWCMDMAFNLPRGGKAIRAVWNRIPVDTDILVTHGPPHGVMDQVGQGERQGCEELLIRLAAVKPRLHVFGHIHDGYGTAVRRGTTFVNASICDEDSQAVNAPVTVRLKPGAKTL